MAAGGVNILQSNTCCARHELAQSWPEYGDQLLWTVVIWLLRSAAGIDCGPQFREIGHSPKAQKLMDQFLIGELQATEGLENDV